MSDHPHTPSRAQTNLLTSFGYIGILGCLVISFAEKSSRFLARLLAACVLLLGLVTTARADLTSGLVAYYPFDGNASDMSGNGNDGTVSGAILGADRHGATGKAYGFDGSNDYIQIGNNNSLNVSSSSPFTFGFWFKPSSSQAGGITLKNGQYGFQWQGSSSSVRYYDNTYRNSSKTSWNLNEWHHMAMVQTGSHLYLYVDGQPDSNHSTTYQPALVNDSLYIGKHPNYFGAFNGSLDDVRIYDRALSAAEVAALYQLESTPPNQAPVFADANATFTTAENNASASFVVSATDPDANTTLVYAKSGPDADKFDLNASTGTLTFTNTPDFEANASAAGNNAYSLTITVTDGEANATQSVTVNVTDLWEDADSDGLADHIETSGSNQIKVRAQIDGKSQLVLNKGSVKWNHILYSKPGKHGGDHATTLDDSTEWWPNWTGNVSDEFNGTNVDLRGMVQMQKLATRDSATILQQPDASNGYTTIVEIFDSSNGSFWHEFVLTGEGNSGYLLDPNDPDTDDDGFNDGLEVSVGSDGRNASSTPLTTGLVAYYPFDGNASDMSGNGNHGTVNGAISGTDRHGAAGQAYSFDGVNDFIESNDSSTLDFSGNLSLSFWINPIIWGTGTTKLAGVISKKSSNSNNGYVVYHDYTGSRQNKINYRYKGNSSTQPYLHSTTSVNLNQWVHWSVSQDQTSVKWYRNGMLDKSYSISQAGDMNTNTKLHIGNAQTWHAATGDGQGNTYFNGSLDDVRIYDRALSAVEVAALYQLENTPPNQPPAFAESNATFTVAENNASASFVVTATDPDANTTLVYAKSGADAGKFDLNASTGQLTFTNTPDFEANASASAAGNNAFSLTITVTDGEANATQSVTVNVTNMVEDFDGDGVEDHFDTDDDDDGFSDTAEIAYGSDPRNPASVANQAPTAIDLNGTTAAENQPVGAIVGDFNATDPDANATHVFALVEGNGSTHNNLFTIDLNGTLKSAVILDHEANATLRIRVRAADEHNASMEKTFVITILDDGQEDSDGDGIEDHVDPDDDNDGFTDAEEVEGGSDPDDNASFLAIISGSVNYDGTATGPVLMQVRSSAGPATVTVEMLDSFGDGWNGAQLTIKDDSNQTAFSGTLPDGNGSETEVVLQAGDDYFVSVTSGDYPDEVSWNISSGSEDFAEGEAPVAGQAFSPVGDVLKVILPQLGSYQLEMPNNATYELGVLLDVDEDGEPDLLEPFGFYAGGPITLSSGNLAGINIMLTNNHAPTDLHLSNVTIAENQPAGTIVGDFNATDLNANSTHTFAFTDGNGSTHHHLFAIDANGTLRTAAVLDYEANASLSVSVRVTDEENASLEKVLHILVHNDVHEDADADGLKEFEEETLGTSDLDDDSDGDGAKDGDEFALGSDPDSNASFPVTISGTVTYGGTAGGAIHVLAMEGSGGVVTIEMMDSYGDGWNGTELTIVDDANITVYVGTFYKGHEASVTIDLVPERTYVVNVSEGEYPVEVSWGILTDGEVLASGEAPEEGVTFAAPGIVKEVVLAQPGTYQLAVPSNLAYQVGVFLDVDGDGEIGPLEPAGFHSEEPVTANGNLSGINVEMVDNAAPTDLALSVGAVTENHQAGSFVGVFTVNDPDDLNGSGPYSIDLVDGNGSDHNQHFAIEGNQLKAVSPDYESGPVHSIRVRASDDRGAAIENTFFITVVDDPRDNPLELGNSRLFAPESAWEDRFGSAVSLLDDLLAVGATRADGLDHNETGAVYLYQVDANGSATYLFKVAAPDGAEEDEFGSSVSQAGDLLAIGATRADGVDHNGTGAVYLYQVDANGSAAYLAKVMAPDGAEDDWFGSSISQTGDLLAIGAGRANGMDQNHTGAAYLYRTESNGSATYLAKLAAPDGAEDDWFGGSISQAGDLLVIGAPRANGIDHNHTGAAYLYRTESNGSATYLAKLTLPDDSENDGVGFSVSVSGNIVVVGAWGVDSEENGDAGAAYVYRVETNGSATHATYLTKLTAPDAVSFTYFGYQVSQSGDLLAIGSNNGIYMYRVDANGSVTGLKKANIQDVAEEDPFDDGAISLTGELLAVGMMLFDPEGDEEETGVDEEEVDPEEDATGTVYLFNLASLNNKPPSHLHLSGVTVARNKAPGTVVGQLQAVDPDDQNGTGEYYFEFVEGNGSQHNHLFAIDTNGTLRSTTVLDHESNSTLSIRVRATDEHNASIEQTFVITVLDDPADNNTSVVDSNATIPDTNGMVVDTNGTYVDDNATIPDNNATVPDSNGTYVDDNATVPDENGTFVETNTTSPDNNGTLPDSNATVPNPNATLPDGNATIPDSNGTVAESNEPHPDQNGTFVDPNATLPDDNAAVTDSNATVPDPNDTFVDHNQTHVDVNGTIPDANATVPEHNETIAPPVPTYRPIARTLRAETDAEGRLKLNGVVLTDGGATVTEVGFILSNSLFAGLNSPGAITVGGTLSGDAFTASAAMPDLGKRFYYRAYATNAKGTNFGSPKRLVVPEPVLPAAWWASTEEATAGWRISPWFGAFRPYENGWIFHADLGWLYVQPDGVDGLWVWSKGKGWLWTYPGSYRYLYQAATHRWLYFLKLKDGQPRFYNHATGIVE